MSIKKENSKADFISIEHDIVPIINDQFKKNFNLDMEVINEDELYNL